LETLVDTFQKKTGLRVVIAFATAPVLRRQAETGEVALDVVIAPAPLVQTLEENGYMVAGGSVVIGTVKAGVAVREGAPAPDISTAEALRKEILASQSLVFNEGSSGIYVEKLLERLGVTEAVKTKITRLPNAEAVMNYLASSRIVKEIGFGQITAIRLYANQGVRLVGPLPQEIGNTTTYRAGVSARTKNRELAEELIRFLIAPSAREIFHRTGVE
jgi:molybdate transport system substrate-binding protein